MRYAGVENQLDQPVYDTIRLAVAAGGQTVSFFRIPFGGLLAAGIVKGYHDTNMMQAGSLEKGLTLSVKAMSFNVLDTAAGAARVSLVDYLNIMNSGHLNVLVGQVTVLRCPVVLMPPGPAETNYFSNIAPAATEFKSTHGAIAGSNKFWLDNPFTLEENEAIQVDLQVPGAVAAVTDVQFYFWGDLVRPVR